MRVWKTLFLLFSIPPIMFGSYFVQLSYARPKDDPKLIGSEVDGPLSFRFQEQSESLIAPKDKKIDQSQTGSGIKKLDQKYLVRFGDPEAKIKIVQFFSMTCPHCLLLFKNDFRKIKEAYLETKEVSWVFHPVPLDSLTIQMMDCLSHLEGREKEIFLEAILETVQVQDDENVIIFLMQEAMNVFGNPIQNLDEQDYITNSEAFKDSFHFITQENRIDAVPAVEVNGILYRREIPDYKFIKKQLRGVHQ